MANPVVSLRGLRSLGDVAAEDDAVLDYFLATDAVREIPQDRKFLVLGRKGSGKTAIVRFFTEGADCMTALAANLRSYPWGLHASLVTEGASEAEAYLSSWRYLIAVRLGSLALRQEKALVSTSAKALTAYLNENYGGVDPALSDILRPARLKLSRLSFEPQVLGNKLGGVDLARLSASPGVGPELDALADAILEAVAAIMVDGDLEGLSIHFDELDQGLTGSDSARSQMIIGLVLAAREVKRWFAGRSLNALPVVYLRTDLWESLRFSDKNKISYGNSFSLEWDSDQLKSLVDARLRKLIAPGACWETVTSSGKVRGTQSKWSHVLARTFLRPRDVIQFFNEALKEAHRRSQEPLVIENPDVVAAREAYSQYLKLELDDEVAHHWPEWEEALQACSAISTITFKQPDFAAEYGRLRSKSNLVEPEDALRLLYQFSVIGCEQRSGYGGSSWAFRYTNPEAAWDDKSPRFKVHLGLKEFAKLREERSAG